MAKHSDFPASSSYRWMRCAGSVQLIKRIGKAPTESRYAVEGTRAHSCLEFLMRRSVTPLAIQQAHKKWPEEMVNHAVNSAAIIYAAKPSKSAKLLIETKVSLAHVVQPKDSPLFGTLDYAWLEEWGDLVSLDYKYGAGHPVLPYDDELKEENPQLMYYASGLAQTVDYEIDKIILGIIQPRVWSEGENPLSTYTTTVKRLKEFERKVKEKVLEASSKNPKLTAGDHCKWCPAAHGCPEVSRVQMENAGIEFEVEKGITHLPDVQALGPANLPKVLDAIDILEGWMEQVRARAFQFAAYGIKIDGRKMVQKRAFRKWIVGAEKKIEIAFGEEAFKREPLSPAQFEKVFKSNKAFVSEHTESISSGVTLVKESDRRPEVENIEFEVDGPDEDK